MFLLIGSCLFLLSDGQKQIWSKKYSSLTTGPRIFSTQTTMQGWVLFDKLTLLSNKHNWEKQGVCGAKTLQVLNLNRNPKLYFAVKLYHFLKGGVWVIICYLNL